MNHNRTYTAALVILAVLSLASAGVLLFLSGAATASTIETHLPAWSMPWVAVLNFTYAVAIGIVLCARQFQPETGRRLTRALNWALLPALPGGTLVGLFGLLRADQSRK